MGDANLWLIEQGFGVPIEAFLLGVLVGWVMSS